MSFIGKFQLTTLLYLFRALVVRSTGFLLSINIQIKANWIHPHFHWNMPSNPIDALQIYSNFLPWSARAPQICLFKLPSSIQFWHTNMPNKLILNRNNWREIQKNTFDGNGKVLQLKLIIHDEMGRISTTTTKRASSIIWAFRWIDKLCMPVQTVP